MREHLDVFMLHSPRSSDLRDPELVETLMRLRRSGDIRAWGVSAATLADAAAALEMPGLDCVEVGLSVCDRSVAPLLVASAAKRGVAVIARQPFGSGKLLRQTQGVGRRSDSPHSLSVSVSQGSILRTCLQYPLSIDGVSAVIAGMSKSSHVVQSSALLQAAPPSIAELDSISAHVCAGAHRAD